MIGSLHQSGSDALAGFFNRHFSTLIVCAFPTREMPLEFSRMFRLRIGTKKRRGWGAEVYRKRENALKGRDTPG